MRNSVSKIALFGLMMCVASATFGARCSAAENFVGWHEDGVFYRFDNSTGEIHKLVKPLNGTPMWVKCEVRDMTAPAPKPPQSTQPLPTVRAPAPAIASAPPFRPQPGAIIDAGAMPTISPDQVVLKHPVAAKRQIEVFNDKDENITNVIDDAERAKCRSEINAYDALHVSHTLKTSGDHIAGIVILENKGNRKIDRLELTMTVRVTGKEKPVECKRFLFEDTAAGEKPPAPSFGSSGLSVLKKIDIPTPSGVFNGAPDVRVTYIHFDDRE